MKYEYRYTEIYKDTRIDVKARTHSELLDKVNRRKKQIDMRTAGQFFRSDTKLLAFGKRYIDTYKKNNVSERWYKNMITILNNHIVAGIGNKEISKIRLIEIQQMLNDIQASKDYINKIYNLTCQIFHAAYKNGLTVSDLSEDLIKPKGTRTRSGRSLDEYEQQILLKVLPGHKMELICKLMLFCGLRTKEARELLWKDIDLKNGLINVHGTKTVNAERTVPIPDVFLKELKASSGSGRSFSRVCELSEQQTSRGWRNIKRLMNIEMGCRTYRNKLLPPYPLQEPCRLYDLRHTYCTNLEAHGVPISIASRLMGHSDISITAQIYTHENDKSIEIARALINGKADFMKRDVETSVEKTAVSIGK